MTEGRCGTLLSNMTTEQKVYVGLSLLTIVLLIGGVWFATRQDAKLIEKESQPLAGKEVAIQNAVHVSEGESHEEYSTNPPTSGPHYGSGVAGAGIHEEEVADELLVHSLEHGAVILSYKADLPEEEVARLTDVFTSAAGKKIMVPRENLDVPVALTSWGRILKLKEINEASIKNFIEVNSDRGPEKASI